MEQSLLGEKSRKMVCRSEQKWYKREWPEKNKRNEPENNNKEGAEKKKCPSLLSGGHSISIGISLLR